MRKDRVIRGRLTRWRLAGIGVIALIYPFVAVLSGFGAESKQQPGRFVFDLDEVSAFEPDRQVGFSFFEGQRSYCTEEAADTVKVYPAFKSDKPFYGSVEFRSGYDGDMPRTEHHFALDESGGTGAGYDRFYFDLNGDLDLTNDAVLSPHKDPPNKMWLRGSSAVQQTTFEYLNIPFEFGSEGMRSLQILPWFVITRHLPPLVKFVNPTVHKSKIELGGHRYDVWLGHDYMIAGWFHRPLTAVFLIPEGERHRISWKGADRLMALRKIGGKYYQLSATPKGDTLTVQEYDGPFGTFEIGLGARDIQPGKIAVNGSFRSRDIAVAAGGPKHRLPVGDYLPTFLTIDLGGRMIISLSDNYHADGELRGAVKHARNYMIEIRRDKPYVLDFSDKPEVIFVAPAKDYRLKLGDELTVKAVLVDSESGVMIRDLKGKMRSRSADGGRGSIGKYVSLDPKVIITRSTGEKVTEGVMP
ncbi:MAG: hypothetical protein ACYSWQ_15280, partial [Planctomycetota bacterium]